MMGQTGAGKERRRIVPRSFWTRALYSFSLIAAVVLIGTLGMHFLEGWSYLDSFYYTSFIATGQGPPGNLLPGTSSGKVFTSVLAFVSVGTVITALLFLFGPFLGRVLKAGEEKLEEVEKEVEDLGKRQTTGGGRDSPHPDSSPRGSRQSESVAPNPSCGNQDRVGRGGDEG